MVATVKHVFAQVSVILPVIDLAIFLLLRQYAVERIFGNLGPLMVYTVKKGKRREKS